MYTFTHIAYFSHLCSIINRLNVFSFRFSRLYCWITNNSLYLGPALVEIGYRQIKWYATHSILLVNMVFHIYIFRWLIPDNYHQKASLKTKENFLIILWMISPILYWKIYSFSQLVIHIKNLKLPSFTNHINQSNSTSNIMEAEKPFGWNLHDLIVLSNFVLKDFLLSGIVMINVTISTFMSSNCICYMKVYNIIKWYIRKIYFFFRIRLAFFAVSTSLFCKQFSRVCT